jgi:hypothetical protein
MLLTKIKIKNSKMAHRKIKCLLVICSDILCQSETPGAEYFSKVCLNHYWYILTVSRKGGLYQNKKERI